MQINFKLFALKRFILNFFALKVRVNFEYMLLKKKTQVNASSHLIPTVIKMNLCFKRISTKNQKFKYKCFFGYIF